MEPIDFVILWVDGNDPAWQKERNAYAPSSDDNGNDENRFRDWDLLRYWFRGVEQFAPWVHRIYFITWGHYPQWLNLDHPRLKLVRHEEFIPKENLPTFNGNVIELYLHLVPGLSERFVLFNDDMFLTQPVKEEDFFIGNLPRESALLDTPAPDYVRNVFPHMMLNNAAVINQHFSKKEVLRRHAAKFFCPQYGMGFVRNLLLSPLAWFSCFRSEHTPISHLKSTFETVWQAEGELLAETGSHRFRSGNDVTHWLMKDWRLCNGEFIPRSRKWGKCFELGQDRTEDICSAIEAPKWKAICINDSTMNIAFTETKELLINSFEKLLPKRSGFENDYEEHI